jgi:hypothetical protein
MTTGVERREWDSNPSIIFAGLYNLIIQKKLALVRFQSI